MATLVNILIIVLILSITIFIHEFGHLIMALKVGATVREFSIGFGPKIFCKKYKKINYCIRLIPVGGFVDILGDQQEEVDVKDPGNLANKTFSQRAIVMLAGVTMNYLLAVFLFYILLISNDFTYKLPSASSAYNPPFGSVTNQKVVDYQGIHYKLVKDTPADRAKIPEEGYIVEINNTKLNYYTEVGNILGLYKNKRVHLKVCLESGSCHNYDVNVDSDGKLGVLLESNFVRTVSFDGFGNRLFSGFEFSVNWLSYMKYMLASLYQQSRQNKDFSVLGNSLGGPVALYGVVKDVQSTQLGFKDSLLIYLSLTADISMTLFIMNLIPIPALDGGRVLLLVFEKLFGKYYSKKIESFIIGLSFILLLLLTILITIKDVHALK